MCFKTHQKVLFSSTLEDYLRNYLISRGMHCNIRISNKGSDLSVFLFSKGVLPKDEMLHVGVRVYVYVNIQITNHSSVPI